MAQVTGLFDLGYGLSLVVARKFSVDVCRAVESPLTTYLQDMFPPEQPPLGSHAYYYTL